MDTEEEKSGVWTLVGIFVAIGAFVSVLTALLVGDALWEYFEFRQEVESIPTGMAIRVAQSDVEQSVFQAVGASQQQVDELDAAERDKLQLEASGLAAELDEAWKAFDLDARKLPAHKLAKLTELGIFELPGGDRVSEVLRRAGAHEALLTMHPTREEDADQWLQAVRFTGEWEQVKKYAEEPGRKPLDLVDVLCFVGAKGAVVEPLGAETLADPGRAYVCGLTGEEFRADPRTMASMRSSTIDRLNLMAVAEDDYLRLQFPKLRDDRKSLDNWQALPVSAAYLANTEEPFSLEDALTLMGPVMKRRPNGGDTDADLAADPGVLVTVAKRVESLLEEASSFDKAKLPRRLSSASDAELTQLTERVIDALWTWAAGQAVIRDDREAWDAIKSRRALDRESYLDREFAYAAWWFGDMEEAQRRIQMIRRVRGKDYSSRTALLLKAETDPLGAAAAAGKTVNEKTGYPAWYHVAFALKAGKPGAIRDDVVRLAKDEKLQKIVEAIKKDELPADPRTLLGELDRYQAEGQLLVWSHLVPPEHADALLQTLAPGPLSTLQLYHALQTVARWRGDAASERHWRDMRERYVARASDMDFGPYYLLNL